MENPPRIQTPAEMEAEIHKLADAREHALEHDSITIDKETSKTKLENAVSDLKSKNEGMMIRNKELMLRSLESEEFKIEALRQQPGATTEELIKELETYNRLIHDYEKNHGHYTAQLEPGTDLKNHVEKIEERNRNKSMGVTKEDSLEENLEITA